MTDSVQEIFEHLTVAGTPLYQAVGDRIFSPVCPVGFNNEKPCIVFHQSSGYSHASAATSSEQFTFKCYGGSPMHKDARRIYRLLWDRLHGRGSAGNLMKAFHVAGSQNPTVDPETGWPMCWATYTVLVHETV